MTTMRQVLLCKNGFYKTIFPVLKNKKYLILFSSIFLFFAFVLHQNVSSVDSYQDIDSKAYISNATRLAQTGSIGGKDIPYYALGYAFFLALIYKIFGINNALVTWVQVFLALCTIFLIFKVTGYLFDKRVALIAFILACLNLGFLVFSQFILTEILLTFLLVFFFERFVLFLKSGLFTHLAQSGFLLGLSIVVKPAALYFIFFLVLFLFIFLQDDFVKKLKIVGLLCAFFYLPVVGYMAFNKITYNSFQIAALGNENLYFYLFPKVLANQNNTDPSFETKKLWGMLSGSKLVPESWREIKQLFWDKFFENPYIFLKIWMLNVGKTALGLFSSNLKVLVEPGVRGGDISFFKQSGTFFQKIRDYIFSGTDSLVIKSVALLEALWTLLRYFLIGIALFFLTLKKKWELLFLFLFYIFYFSMITGHDGCARFRMMFEPVLIILAAYGLEQGFITLKIGE